jgi:hypothetical protein
MGGMDVPDVLKACGDSRCLVPGTSVDGDDLEILECLTADTLDRVPQEAAWL